MNFRRWSREKVQFHVTRLRKPRIRTLAVYSLVIFLCFLAISARIQVTPQSSSSSLVQSEENSQNLRTHLEDHQKVKSAESKQRRSRLEESRRRVKKDAPLPKDATNPHNFHLMISNAAFCDDLPRVSKFLGLFLDNLRSLPR